MQTVSRTQTTRRNINPQTLLKFVVKMLNDTTYPDGLVHLFFFRYNTSIFYGKLSHRQTKDYNEMIETVREDIPRITAE